MKLYEKGIYFAGGVRTTKTSLSLILHDQDEIRFLGQKTNKFKLKNTT